MSFWKHTTLRARLIWKLVNWFVIQINWCFSVGWKHVEKGRKMFSFFRRSVLMAVYSTFSQQFYLSNFFGFVLTLMVTIPEKKERSVTLGTLRINLFQSNVSLAGKPVNFSRFKLIAWFSCKWLVHWFGIALSSIYSGGWLISLLEQV